MNTNQKGFANIVFIIVVVAIIAVGGYFIFVKKSKPVSQQQNTTSTQNNNQTQIPEQNTIKITDKGNLYSVEIPKSWKVIESIGARGVSLSSIAIESPDWKGHSDNSAEGPCSPVYYEAGASFTIGVQQGEQQPAHYGKGGDPETGVMKKKNIVVDGISGVYHAFKEPCTSEGQLVDAHVNYKGNNYVFRMAYNPNNSQGETVFMNILNSVKFTK